MNKTALVLVLGALVIVSATCFHALAEPPGPPPVPPAHGPGFFGGPLGPPPFGLLAGPPDLVEKLKLTDDQKKEMRLAYVGFQDKTRKARTALMALRDEKEAMLVSGRIDEAKLAKLDEGLVKLASEVMGEHLKMEREHLLDLTPDQLNLLADFIAKKELAHGPKIMGK